MTLLTSLTLLNFQNGPRSLWHLLESSQEHLEVFGTFKTVLEASNILKQFLKVLRHFLEGFQ